MTEVPTYGSLTPTQEFRLYREYHWLWQQYISPENAAKRIASADDAYINWQWPAWDKPYKAAVWALMTPAERERIRRVRASG